MHYEVRGQEDVSVLVGGAGDRTITVAITGSHVSLRNNDPMQPVLYAIVAAPVFPADWIPLAPGANLVLDMGGGAVLYLRKKRWIRYAGASVRVAVPGTPFPSDDVTAFVEVTDITY